MKTLIIEYGLNNTTVQINLVINCKTYVRLMQQPLPQLLFHFFSFESFIISRINNLFIYYVLSKQKLKKSTAKSSLK